MTDAQKSWIKPSKDLPRPPGTDQLTVVPPYHIVISALQEGTSVSELSPVIAVPRQLLEFLLSRVIRCLPFDEASYLDANPDVRRSISSGEVQSAKEHFCRYGYFEHRIGNTQNVDETWYKATNPDVADAIRTGAVDSACDHYTRWGAAEWRAPNRDAVALVEFWKSLLVRHSDHRHADM
jgi:hypothetical protein